MTRRNRAKSSSLFLMELILAILFFSVASAVCVQFFVKSHLLSQDARELERSVNEVSSAAELIKTSQSSSDAIEQICSQFSSTESPNETELLIYYDKEFLAPTASDAVYSLNIAFHQEGTMLNATLTMNRINDNKSIYSLDVSQHLQRRAGDD